MQELRGWGFNTVGAWSDPAMFTAGMTYTFILDAAESAPRQPSANAGVPDYFPEPGYFPDYFSEEFRKSTDSRAQKLCAPRANEPWLLGYFTDNEQSWALLRSHGVHGTGFLPGTSDKACLRLTFDVSARLSRVPEGGRVSANAGNG